MDIIDKDNYELDIKQLLIFVLRRLWIVILTFFITVSIGYGYSRYMIEPQYASTAQLYILTRNDSLNNVSLADLQI